MPIVNRGNKAGGGTDFNTGQLIIAAENNADINTLFTLVNGGLDADNLAAGAVGISEMASGAVTNDKVAAAAAISVSKLDQTAGQLDADIVDDFATDDTEYGTRTDPLDSVATPALPTNLEEELARIRFVLARYGLGIPTKITDGTNAAGWFDGLVLGPNLVPNGSFLDNAATPLGCAIAGAPATQNLVALPATEGYGKYLHLADAAGATTDGPSWTLAGLRANTLYVVEARVLNTTAEVNLATTGATGTLGNLDLDTNSMDAHPESLATDWQTLAGLIETDATPTDIVVQLFPSAAAYDFGVAYVSVREVSGSRDAEGTGREHTAVRGGSISKTASSASSSIATMQTETTLTFVVPGPNYQAIVHGRIAVQVGGSTTRIQENLDVDGVGSYANVDSHVISGEIVGVPMFWASGILPAGKVVGYRLSSSANIGTGGHRIVVTLQRMAD